MDSPSPIAGPDPFQDDLMTSPPSRYSTRPPDAFNPSALQSASDFNQAHPQQPLQGDTRPFSEQAPPRQRMPQSQYYIVFSVTGIERSNVKNPIIRFDAKVAPSMLFIRLLMLTYCSRPIFRVSVPHLYEISDELITSL